MATSALAVPTTSENVFRKFGGLLPGIVLLFAVGYAGKLLEITLAVDRIDHRGVDDEEW